MNIVKRGAPFVLAVCGLFAIGCAGGTTPLSDGGVATPDGNSGGTDGGGAPVDASTDTAQSAMDSGKDAVADARADAPADGCVDIDLSTFDQSCNQASDCVWVTGGVLCPTSCMCGTGFINTSAEAQYTAATSGIVGEACPCTSPGIAACTNHVCVSGVP